MSKSDGGPAFPREDYQSGAFDRGQCGMSLRDYFAAKALPVAFWALDRGEKEDTTTEAVAVVAYELADAMMKAREQ